MQSNLLVLRPLPNYWAAMQRETSTSTRRACWFRSRQERARETPESSPAFLCTTHTNPAPQQQQRSRTYTLLFKSLLTGTVPNLAQLPLLAEILRSDPSLLVPVPTVEGARPGTHPAALRGYVACDHVLRQTKQHSEKRSAGTETFSPQPWQQ